MNISKYDKNPPDACSIWRILYNKYSLQGEWFIAFDLIGAQIK